ncbi:MAG TPA: SDR family NAD(P)-dependent oxidoreductase [Candidatus Angelobacter sp.]
MGLSTNCSPTDIAVIGMAGRLPKAADPQQFWERIRNGEDCISFFSEEELRREGVDEELLKLPNYVPAAPVIDDIEQFDASFFGITPREAELMDPQHRLFMECCWEALEDAGYDPSRHSKDIGLFAGARTDTYLITNLISHREIVQSVGPFHLGLGNDLAFLTTRVSHNFNLRGPSCSLHIACSTSLVAVHLACQSLLIGESQMALAGGVAINVPHKVGYICDEGSVVSPDGHCRVFDREARGTVFGSGVGVVVLKRLEDALADGDHVYAVIKGSAINNDGSSKASFTAPGVQGQTRVIREAQLAAGVDPETISYVECHGTGTLLGDAVEIRALTRAFRTQTAKTGFCAVGSVKSNVGHLDAAAGITGLIKVVQSLRHKMIPPSLHFSQPNPQIDFAHSPFYVNTELKPWESDGKPRRAGLSAFGVGGTNAHVVLEEAPLPEEGEKGGTWHILPISARSGEALHASMRNLGEWLRRNPQSNFADVAFTLQAGRRQFAHRWAGVFQDHAEAIAALEAAVNEDPGDAVEEDGRKIAFLFPGQGSQYPGMAEKLYQEEKVFRESMEKCGEILRPQLGRDLCRLIYEEKSAEIDQTWLSQPALFAVEYSLAQLWKSRGIQPKAFLGHSIGEYTAACLASVMSLEDALKVVSVRGKIMQQLPPGAMVAVSLRSAEIRKMLGPNLSIAAINAADLVVVSGTLAEIERLEGELQQQGVNYRRLRTSHAFHSPMVEPAMAAFRQTMKQVQLRLPAVPFISNVSGAWIQDNEAQDPEYWVRHLREPVQFERGLRHLADTGEWMLVEVGPGQTLRRLAQRQGVGAVASLSPNPGDGLDDRAILQAFSALWQNGTSVNWQELHNGVRRNRVPLPTYPFEHKRYWIDPCNTISQGIAANASAIQKIPKVSEWFWRPSWRQSVLTGKEALEVKPQGSWIIFADEGGLGLALGKQLENRSQRIIYIYKGEGFRSEGKSYYINPLNSSDYREFVAALGQTGVPIENLLHLWSLDVPDNVADETAFFVKCQESGILSLLHAIQALPSHSAEPQYKLHVVTRRAVQVESHDRADAQRCGVLAFCRVLQQEDQAFTARVIDLEPDVEAYDSRTVQRVLEEIVRCPSDSVIAYRGPNRWVENYQKVSLSNQFSIENALEKDGVYLITGGLGAVGLLIAEWIFRVAKGKLILTGRSPVPPRDRWEELLNDATPSEQSRRIQKLHALEQAGAEILIISADVADAAEMRKAFDQSISRFGKIDGVIHAAGVTSGPSVFCPMQETGKQECDIQARPKALGLMVLKELVKDIPVQFVLCISSNASVLGGLGFTAYSSANLFLDMFVQRQQVENGSTRWIVSNWDHWPQEAKKLTNFRTSMDEFAMTREEAEEAFLRLLALPLSGQVIVSTGDLRARSNLWTKKQVESQANPAGDVALTAAPKNPRPKVKSAYIGPRNEVERVLASIWAKALGLEQIGVNDDFFELGGHSLLATRLILEVREAFNVAVPLAKMFEGPTVAQMASFFSQPGEKPVYTNGLAQPMKAG